MSEMIEMICEGCGQLAISYVVTFAPLCAACRWAVQANPAPYQCSECLATCVPGDYCCIDCNGCGDCCVCPED